MGDDARHPAPGSSEMVFGPARPNFVRKRRGFDPNEVSPYLDMLERERSDLGTALVLAQARVRELTAKVERYEALEDELTRSLHLGKQTADAVIADAQARASAIRSEAQTEADRLLRDGRRDVHDESAQLDGLRMAIAAEAAQLGEVEKHLDTRISRAARALVQIVDAQGGLGPFSQATATLLEFAELLQNTARSGTAAKVEFDISSGGAVARFPASEQPAAPPPPAPPRSAAAAVGVSS